MLPSAAMASVLKASNSDTAMSASSAFPTDDRLGVYEWQLRNWSFGLLAASLGLREVPTALTCAIRRVHYFSEVFILCSRCIEAPLIPRSPFFWCRNAHVYPAQFQKSLSLTCAAANSVWALPRVKRECDPNVKSTTAKQHSGHSSCS
jgi:hypothetical protein